MNLVLLKKSSTPLWEQLCEQLRASIASGEVKPGECLPSIRSLARELAISVITVKLAYEKLESEGLIFTRAGKGCFVSESEDEKILAKKNALKRAEKEIEYCRDMGCSQDEIALLLSEVFSREKEFR